MFIGYMPTFTYYHVVKLINWVNSFQQGIQGKYEMAMLSKEQTGLTVGSINAGWRQAELSVNILHYINYKTVYLVLIENPETNA